MGSGSEMHGISHTVWYTAGSFADEDVLLAREQCPKDPSGHGWMHLYGCPNCEHEVRVCLICQMGIAPPVPPRTYAFPSLPPHFCANVNPRVPVPVALVLVEET